MYSTTCPKRTLIFNSSTSYTVDTFKDLNGTTLTADYYKHSDTVKRNSFPLPGSSPYNSVPMRTGNGQRSLLLSSPENLYWRVAFT